MIDTIVLRLHGLKKYETVLKELELQRNKGFQSETAKVEIDEVKRLRDMGITKAKEILQVLKINRTGEFLIKTEVGKHVNSSGHYAFTYFVNWTKDYIEFNFSVPKYKFGSNVIMFIEHLYDRDFKYHENSTFDYNIKRAPVLIINYIKHFFNKEFVSKINYGDLEVNRVDVCFNQVFRSKEDALKYLEYQKKLKKKYAKDEEGVMREYATSLMYVTKKYSAKIYHKGSEYKAHDSKEHIRINKEKGVEYFKIEHFQSFADRILRYELTLRNGYLNYLFKNNLFRKDCRIFKMDYKIYQAVLNSMQKNERISKRIGVLSGDEKKEYIKNHPYEKIDKNNRNTYKYISKIMEKRTYFLLEIRNDVEIYNKETVNYSCNQARFGKNLLRLCLNKLHEFIKEFQISDLPEIDKIGMRIDSYNSINVSKLPKGDMMVFYELLQKHGSFKELAKYCNYSRATIYRYISRFKLIGITETGIIPIGSYSLPEASIDMKSYQTFLCYEHNLLRGIKIN